MIVLCRPAISASAHSVSPRLAATLEAAGVVSRFATIGSAPFAQLLQNRLGKRMGQRVVKNIFGPFWRRRMLNSIRPGDVVWVYTNGHLVLTRDDTRFEQGIRGRGASYVLYLPDAWPLAGPFLQQACARRVALADLVVVPTPPLLALIQERFPAVRCALCEEPIDTDHIRPMPDDERPPPSAPVVVWTGPDPSKSELPGLFPVFERVARRRTFTLRIVSGGKAPVLTPPVPWEWRPYSQAEESRNVNATAAVAYYSDSPYHRCKGNYKVKTYMAAGQAVLTTPVGYNTTLIRHGVNGLLASTPSEWEDGLLRLLADAETCRSVRSRARRDTVARYSYQALAPHYIEILKTHFREELSTP